MALDTDNATAVEAAAVRPCWLAKFAFPSGALAICGNDFDLTYDGTTYTANGQILDVRGLRADINLKVPPVVFQMPADSTLIPKVRDDAYQFKIATLYIAFLDVATGTLTRTPELVSRFYMSHATIGFAKGQATLDLTCESKAILLRRRNTVSMSTADQDRRYSGDTFFHMTNRVPDNDLPWGGRVHRPASPGGEGVAGFGTGRLSFVNRPGDRLTT